MKHYLIDYENVHEEGLKQLHATEEDTIYLFYTRNAAKIGLDALAEISARICVIRVAAGKQSLDMHLISYLGYLLSKHGREDEYVVVSNDTDFDSVISHWSREHGFVHISKLRTNEVKSASKKETAHLVETPAQKKEYASREEKLRALLAETGAGPETCAAVIGVMDKFATDDNAKQQIYRALIKKYGQKKGLLYYNSVKKEI